MCEVGASPEHEDMPEVLLAILDARGLAVRALECVIAKEVRECEHESTLFRGNSFATKMLTSFGRARGYHYLRATLRDLMLSMCKRPRDYALDIDPHGGVDALTGDGGDQQQQQQSEAVRNLETITEAFLQVITTNARMPRALKDICHAISENVRAKFPESITTAVGGFVFLRLINPAVITPALVDLDLPVDTREIRRGLTHVTKILQSLANNSPCKGCGI